MRLPSALRMLFALALHLVLAAAFAPAAHAANLLNNGGFERGTMTGWSVYNQSDAPYTIELTADQRYVHGGNYAARIRALAGTDNFFIFYTEASLAGLAAGSMLHAQVHIQTENLSFQDRKGSVTPVLAITDTTGTVLNYIYENASLAGTNTWLAEDIYLQLPPGAVKASFQLRLTSGIKTGFISIDDAVIEAVAAPGAPRTDIPLAQVARDAQGTPRLQINGVPRPPLFFFGNSGTPLILPEITRAAAVDVDLIQIPVNLPWSGFSLGRFEQIMRANPNALILPRIHFSVPAYELNKYTGQQVLDQDGQPVEVGLLPSFASDGFIADCKQQLDLLVRLIHNSPYKDRVIGYQLGYVNMGEMFYPDIANHFYDFSEVNRLRFTQWLATRYAGNIGALNVAWNTSLASFSAAQIPAESAWTGGDDGVFRSPVIRQAVADFQRYLNENQVDRMTELAAYIKTLTASRSLVALFYGYQNELVGNGSRRGIGHSGHLAARRILQSPSIDILCSPVSYFERKAGDPCNMMTLVDSTLLAGKLFLQEEDSNTWVVDPTNNPDPYNTTYSTEFDTLNCLRRNFGNVLAHNQAMWWCDLWADGRYDADSIWVNNGKLAEAYRDSLEHSLLTQPQVALIYDEESYFWLKADSYDLTYANAFAQRSVFQSLGAQVGYYNIHDLASIPASARLFVFVNTFRIDAEKLALVNQLKSSGRTLLWLYAPGYVSTTGLSTAQMTQLTGFAFTRTAAAIDPEVQVLSTGHPIQAGLATQKFGQGAAVAPTFAVDAATTGAVALGTYVANGKTALALRDFSTWQSIFCGAPQLSTPVLRSICRFAGVTLTADGDAIATADATNSNGRYHFAYARTSAGRRGFQLPGEKIPNGGFEKSTAALPTSGYGCWISPHYGALATCSVTQSVKHTGTNACQTGPFSATANQYAEPLGLRLQLVDGKTYTVTGWVYVDGLNAANAGASNYVFLNFQPTQWTAAAQTFKIAEGTHVNLPNRQWVKFSAPYTHHRASTGSGNEFVVLLQVYGAYAATNIVVDDVSVVEEGTTPVAVTEVVSGQLIGRYLTSWTADFALNEQKIFKLVPEGKMAANDWMLFE